MLLTRNELMTLDINQKDSEGRTLRDRVEMTRKYLIMAARNQTTDDYFILETANELRSIDELRSYIPEFLHNYVSSTAFFSDIQEKYRHYKDRDDDINKSLSSLLDYLKGQNPPTPILPIEADKLADYIDDTGVVIPEKLREQAAHMAQSYAVLYCIENTLRAVVDDLFYKEHGEKYWNNITINIKITDKISKIKKVEIQNSWLQHRASTDLKWTGLYYLDFGDIGTIIQSNFAVFKDIFRDEHQLKPRIDDMALCRHLIAHCCNADKDSEDMLISDFKQIMRLLSSEK